MFILLNEIMKSLESAVCQLDAVYSIIIATSMYYITKEYLSNNINNAILEIILTFSIPVHPQCNSTPLLIS